MSGKQGQNKKQTKTTETTEKKVKKSKVVEPPAPPVPPPTPVVADKVEANTTNEVTLSHSFSGLMELVVELQGQLSRVKNEIRLLERNVGKEMKVLDKINAKKNKKQGNRSPSGFVKPTKISDELATFLGKEKGTLMARTDVTKEMTSYIRENKLQDKDNGRIILPDSKLKKLLKVTDSDSLTYFNLQKYMSPHFEKAVKA